MTTGFHPERASMSTSGDGNHPFYTGHQKILDTKGALIACASTGMRAASDSAPARLSRPLAATDDVAPIRVPMPCGQGSAPALPEASGLPAFCCPLSWPMDVSFLSEALRGVLPHLRHPGSDQLAIRPWLSNPPKLGITSAGKALAASTLGAGPWPHFQLFQRQPRRGPRQLLRENRGRPWRWKRWQRMSCRAASNAQIEVLAIASFSPLLPRDPRDRRSVMLEIQSRSGL